MIMRFLCLHRSAWLTASLLLLALLAPAEAQNHAPRQNGQAPAKQQPNTLYQLASGRGRALLAQPVTLDQVAIQNITQNDVVWVGASANDSVLVMLQPSVNPMDAQGNPTPIAAGDVVRVTGHVLAAPSTKVLEGWGVTPADAARVQRQGVVVQAVTFRLLRRAR